MKRPLPTSLTAISIVLVSSPAHGQEPAARGKKDKELCEGLIGRAQQYDRDNTGGLSRAEFTAYWYGLDGGGHSIGSSDDGSNTITLLPPKASDAYSDLLCQCHDIFGHDENCCDDTATDDEIEGDGGGKKGDEIWTEVSLAGFEKEKPKGDQKWYMETFCWYVGKAMKDEGVEFDPAAVVVWDIPTTEAPPATRPPLTSEAPPTTEAPEKPTTTAAADTMPTTTAADEDAPSTVSVEQTVPAVDTTSAATTAAATTTDATTAAATTPVATTVAATTAAATSPPTTTAAATTTATTTESITTTTPEELDPITLRFLGSTNGQVGADSVEIDDITHAFWMVTLDVLGGLFRKRELFESDMSSSNVERLDTKERRLEWDFGEKASVFFESVTMDVKDVDCPSGLVYAAEDSPCLQFKYTLIPNPTGPLTPGTVEEFVDKFQDEVNDNGALYDALVGEYEDTPIVGMGSPGKGTPFEPNANEIIILTSNTSQAQSVQASGFPVGGIVGIALAAALLALVVVAFAVRRVRNKRKRRRELNESNESNLNEDLEANEVNEDANNVEEWLDEEPEEGERGAGSAKSPGSSLAAMGVASTVATRLTTGDTEVMVTERQPWTKNEPVI